MNSQKKRQFGMLVMCGTAVVLSFGLLTASVIAQEKMILTVWDQFGISGFSAAGPAAEKLEQEFEAKYPNIEIVRSFFSSPAIRTVLKAALNTGEQPDFWYTWPASAWLDARARAGYLADLTEAARENGWLDMWPTPLTKRCMLNGRIYGMPFEEDFAGVYYNRDLFDKLGLSEPSTYDEFLDICGKIKSAGLIPLAFGNRGLAQYHARHQITVFTGLTMTRGEFEEILFGERRWDDPKFVEGLRLFKGVADRGFYNEGFNAVGYGEANALFLGGRAAMNITGTWFIEDFVNKAEFNLDMFFLPPLRRGSLPALFIGEGSQWEVSSRLPVAKKEAAIKYLDFLLSDEALPTWVEYGVLPIGKKVDWAAQDVAPVVKEFFGEGKKLMNKGAGIYDMVTSFPPNFTYYMRSNLGAALDGTISIDKFISELQREWDEAKKMGTLWSPGEVPK